MKTRSLLFVCLLVGLSSCVTSKKHNELQSRYSKLLVEKESLINSNEALHEAKDNATLNCKQLKVDYENALAERDAYRETHFESKSRYDNLKLLYNTLMKSKGENNQDNIDIVYKLAAKERHLLKKDDELHTTQKTLQLRAKQIEKLQKFIDSKVSQLATLKDTITQSLSPFANGYITIKQEDNSIQVSITNSLLFKPKTWDISKEGKVALQLLSKAIATNNTMNILVVGHTSSVPFTGKIVIPFMNKIKNNWDLSLVRSVAVTDFMKETKEVLPENLNVAAKGKKEPKFDNNTLEGRMKNDRTEIIISPKTKNFIKLLTEAKS